MDNTENKVAEEILEPVKAVAEVPAETTKKVETASANAHLDSVDKNKFDEIFEALKQIKEKDDFIEVDVLAKLNGGLRVAYQGMPMFLPNAHITLKRSTNDENIDSLVGQRFSVSIFDLQEDETNHKTVIVSRRIALEKQFWNNLKVGEIVKGKVSSIPEFGIFLDLGGFEGLIHITRLGKGRIENPKSIAKIGDELEATIIEIDKENKKIRLSRKDFASTQWKGMAEKYPKGTKVTGIVRRFTDFGTFIEIEPGFDGLLRGSELSWTRRIDAASDILKKQQPVEVIVLSVDEDKERISLSLRQVTENPWNELSTKYTVNSAWNGVISNVISQGVVLTLEDEIDGFIPKSRFGQGTYNKKLPLKKGENLEITVEEINPEKRSLILKPQNNDLFAGMELEFEEGAEHTERRERPERRERGNFGGDKKRNDGNRPGSFDKSFQAKRGGSSFSIADLLSDDFKKNLKK